MNNIHYLLRERKITQKELAKLMGKKEPYISQLVNRPNLNSTQYGTLKKVAGHLGVTVADLECSQPAQATTG